MPNIFQLKTRPQGIERGYLFHTDDFISIGWPNLGDLSSCTREDIRNRLHKAYGFEGQPLGSHAGSINIFVNDVQEQDIVLIKLGILVCIGVVGPYKYIGEYDDVVDEENIGDSIPKIGLCHQRKILWTSMIPANRLNEVMRNFINNKKVISKFRGTFEESELEQFIYKDFKEDDELDDMHEGQNGDSRDTTLNFAITDLQKAKQTLINLLDETDPNIRLKASTIIINLFREEEI